MSTRLVSPDELFADAKHYMLGGKDPVSHADWVLVFNFVAYNVHAGDRMTIMQVFAMIYDAPLSQSELNAIAEFQTAKRRTESATCYAYPSPCTH